MARLEDHPSPLDLKTTEPRLMVIVKRPLIMINICKCILVGKYFSVKIDKLKDALFPPETFNRSITD